MVNPVQPGGPSDVMARSVAAPKAIVDRVYAETVSAFKVSAELRDRFESTGSEIVLNTPADFADRIKREIAEFTKVAREAKISVSQRGRTVASA